MLSMIKSIWKSVNKKKKNLTIEAIFFINPRAALQTLNIVPKVFQIWIKYTKKKKICIGLSYKSSFCKRITVVKITNTMLVHF